MSGIFETDTADSTLFIGGQRISGAQVRNQNVLAAASIANVVKTSLGPVGLDKMMVDELGDVTISNDGATILNLLEVEHPAGKILVELARQQDKEVGDGTTSVVIIAAELLKRANELIKNKLHPTAIITGYRLGCREACKFIAENLAIKVAGIDRDTLRNIAQTTLSSKILGNYGTRFADLTVDAILAVKRTDFRGKPKYPVSSVGILKIKGGSAQESQTINGFAIQRPFVSQAMIKKVESAKIACIDFDLSKVKMKLGVSVVIEDPEALEAIRKREGDITRERVSKILAAGANVVLSARGIDDMYAKMLADAGAVAVTRVSKEELRRVATGTGATIISTLSNLEGDEVFEPACLGSASSVEQLTLSDDDFVVVKTLKDSSCSTVLLRGANDHLLDEMERSLHDSLCTVSKVLESGSVVPGGGAVEAAVDVYLETLASTLGSREQLAVAEFATALLCIPKQLAINAAKDASDLVSKLRAYHSASQQPQANSNRQALKYYGLDLMNGSIRDNKRAGVLEPAINKIKMLKSATEAAIAILRIDDLIKLLPEQQPEDPHAH
ncbi:T-complex protein 1 subunit alpha [Zancudomyces culisetae]|uniref:T-complex protein 1 subunit alpha n=1 Tax=Zancudomyces culisetae TaxID=1213189 RepID=A0A1R1PUR0_ZANCU|nr:T-complex protein 1 subunit alpha [Zancudomyces culisetae]|eukprot:OMH84710.1 T-complex protein 1 subunit alpha [Zancudomyces culisetae]